ncbi:histidine utilization repressor [Thalassotalea aquiviva]|uniref:histidine utilization repressor n=1 Tax=Thalassotalea aquiviva TaxID=3242415 RepID=UPI00352A88E6
MAQPKFNQIKQHIRAQIELGHWLENHKVPSENELASEFDVSRMTARRALQELTDEGVLNRSQGSGTFVANFKSQSSLLEIRNIKEEVEQAGHQYSAKQLRLSEEVADSVIAAQLEQDPGSTVFLSEVLHFQNHLPIQLEQRYVNPHLVPLYIEQDFSTITPHEYLTEEAPLTEAKHQVEAIMVDDTIQQLLAIDAGQPCLRVKRHTWSRAGVVSFAILTAPGDRYRLGSHLKF